MVEVGLFADVAAIRAASAPARNARSRGAPAELEAGKAGVVRASRTARGLVGGVRGERRQRGERGEDRVGLGADAFRGHRGVLVHQAVALRGLADAGVGVVGVPGGLQLGGRPR
ncbi:hypothetical protein SALBM217S_05798 [Streptomyces griseoloalbus]